MKDLWYSARGLTQTPGTALALVLTIALGIGSNAAVWGFVRGLIARDLPLRGMDRIVSVFAQPAQRPSGPLSYEEYLSLERHSDAFEWLGAAAESQGDVVLADRPSVMSIAELTPNLAHLFELSLDGGVFISHRVWEIELAGRADVRGEPVRIDGVETRVAGVAPQWLEGLYLGHAVDVWMGVRKASIAGPRRTTRNVWALGRLRPSISARRAEVALNATRRGGSVTVVPYSGLTPAIAEGMSRIGSVLYAAAAVLFFIACTNVASFLLARAFSRSHETSVRVALGATRRQLARQLLSDSVLVSVTGGALGIVLAAWTVDIIPVFFFDADAERLVFAPNLWGIVAASIACTGITIACGLVPLVEIRHDDPAAVLQRESAGPSRVMRRFRAGLVVAQMTCCCLLVVSAAVLLQGFLSSLQTNTGHRLGRQILVTAEARPSNSRSETMESGLKYFENVEQAARGAADVTATAWMGTLPGDRPAWLSLRIEPPNLPVREVVMDVVALTPRSLELVTLPPVAGRMFGGADTRLCEVVVVNQQAAEALFDGNAVGRSILDESGKTLEVIGVVETRKAAKTGVRSGPAVYYWEEDDASPGRAWRARFGVRGSPNLATGVLDATVVSPSYFDALSVSPISGRLLPENPVPGACRVGVINQDAAELYFAGHALGGAVIDRAGRRTEIIGVVPSARVATLQRGVEPAIYLPLTQDFRPRMTLMLATSQVDDVTLASVRRSVEAVPDGFPNRIAVRTLDAHLSRTALAPQRIATVLVAVSAAIGVALGVLGLYGAMTDSARQRRREIALRIALGAQSRHMVRQTLAEGMRLASIGTVAGMLGSLLVARWLGQITPGSASPAVWVWLAAPVVSVGAVGVAGLLPTRRALKVDPLAIMHDR